MAVQKIQYSWRRYCKHRERSSGELQCDVPTKYSAANIELLSSRVNVKWYAAHGGPHPGVSHSFAEAVRQSQKAGLIKKFDTSDDAEAFVLRGFKM